MKKPLILLGLGFLLFSCSKEPSVYILYSDIPEVVSLIEDYNHSCETDPIEFRYTEDIYAETARNADLLISRDIRPFHLSEEYVLDPLFSEGKLSPDLFYLPLLELGHSEAGQILLPLNFDLPILYYLRDSSEISSGDSLITLDEIRLRATSFNRYQENLPYAMGLSPDWYGEFAYNSLLLSGCSFQFSEGEFLWEQAALESGMSALFDWKNTVNSGLSDLLYFNNQYRYDTDRNLLDAGRVLFVADRLSSLMKSETSLRNTVDFSYPSNGEEIFTTENSVFLALRYTEEDEILLNFILWLFNAENQRHIMESMRDKGLSNFGILDGFSSLPLVNQRIFPLVYPELLGKIPSERSIHFSGVLPSGWDRFKREELFPWLEDHLNQEEVILPDNLLNSWFLQNQNVRAEVSTTF